MSTKTNTTPRPAKKAAPTPSKQILVRLDAEHQAMLAEILSIVESKFGVAPNAQALLMRGLRLVHADTLKNK